MKINILKYVYKSFMAGFPLLTYNPYSSNNFVSEYKIRPYSTYVNYELDFNQRVYLSNYLHVASNNLKMEPLKMFENDEEGSYYLSINIYNCTSPLFSLFTDEPVTRCEINTYVSNEKGEKGTLILDYCSNIISMDPKNIFKEKVLNTSFINNFGNIIGRAYDKYFKFSADIITEELDTTAKLNSDMHVYTDNIYYMNGIVDKLYYDSTLTHGNIILPKKYDISFKFMDLIFKTPHSVFYFNDSIDFTGSLWDNLYSVNMTKI